MIKAGSDSERSNVGTVFPLALLFSPSGFCSDVGCKDQRDSTVR
jgi:hypothetical protein